MQNAIVSIDRSEAVFNYNCNLIQHPETIIGRKEHDPYDNSVDIYFIFGGFFSDYSYSPFDLENISYPLIDFGSHIFIRFSMKLLGQLLQENDFKLFGSTHRYMMVEFSDKENENYTLKFVDENEKELKESTAAIVQNLVSNNSIAFYTNSEMKQNLFNAFKKHDDLGFSIMNSNKGFKQITICQKKTINKKCENCGHVNTLHYWPQWIYPKRNSNLDFRTQRDRLFPFCNSTVENCVNCNYSSDKIDYIDKDIKVILDSDEYKKEIKTLGWKKNHHGAKYQLYLKLLEGLEQIEKAALVALQVAWKFSDYGGDSYSYYRKSYFLFDIIQKNQNPKENDQARFIKLNLARRLCFWREAKEICVRLKNHTTKEPYLTILNFQEMLINNYNDEKYTIEDAFSYKLNENNSKDYYDLYNAEKAGDPNSIYIDYSGDDWQEMYWDAMTDGQYGEYNDGSDY